MSHIVNCRACGSKNRLAAGEPGRTPRCGKCHEALPWIVDAGDTDFAAQIAGPGTVLVDLWAPWCGPCRMVAPILEELARDHAGKLKVVKVNVDTSPQVARDHKVQSIPMLVIYRDGQPVDTILGAVPHDALEDHLQPHL